MAESLFDVEAEVGTVEVRVFRDGRLIHEELCESEEQALLVVDAWADVDGVEFEVRDLSERRPESPPETAEVEQEENGYPEVMEADRAREQAMRRGD